MKNIFVLIVIFFFYRGTCARALNAEKPKNHDYYLNTLGNARDSAYSQVMGLYDAYIQLHPADYLVQIERCRFMRGADISYEEDEGAPGNGYGDCVEDLVNRFKDVPEVLIYKAETSYGDSAKDFLQDIVSDVSEHPAKWEGKEIWKVYNRLADIYETEKEPELAIKYAKLATKHNDTLDLALLIAGQYKELSKNQSAINALTYKWDSTKQDWALNRKAILLEELGDHQDAVKAFRLLEERGSFPVDGESMSKALMATGKYAEARKYLLEETEKSYGKSKALRQLFNYDLAHSKSDSALASYRSLTAADFANDPVGINRLRLFVHAPFMRWSGYDLLRILLLLLLIAGLMLAPYMWVLPVLHIGNYFKNRGMVLTGSDFRWDLKHFWLGSAFLMLVSVFGWLIFNSGKLYPNVMENSGKVNRETADFTVFCFTGFMLGTFALLKRTDLKRIWGTIWEKQRSILTGLGAVLILRFWLGVYLQILKSAGYPLELTCILSIVDSIISMNKFYHPAVGFLFVVLLVPLYEEILFRGVFLSALEKHMPFFFANCGQAFLFALLHDNLKLFPFFFAFGIVTGYMRRSSQSLAAGMTFHMINNLIAFMATLYLHGHSLMK